MRTRRGRSSPDKARKRQGHHYAAGPSVGARFLERSSAEGPRRPTASPLNLTNNLLLAIRRLRPYTPCKKWKEAMVSVMLFWGVGIAILGWLVFKIAERM
jgi:hypothetical protein